MSKVFLGGTCNKSNWREKIIEYFREEGIEYFNPVVEDWTEECMIEEIKQRKLCNFCLYGITPKMTGGYSIAEVVDDSNKKPKQTILVLMKEDNGISFSDDQWKSLNSVARMVENNGSLVFYSLKEAANTIALL